MATLSALHGGIQPGTTGPRFEILQADKLGIFPTPQATLGIIVITDANMRIDRLALHRNCKKWLRLSGEIFGATDAHNLGLWGPGSAIPMLVGQTRYTTGWLSLRPLIITVINL